MIDEGKAQFDLGKDMALRCKKCGWTFSWRPPFLVFGRRYAAVAYQEALEDWVHERPVSSPASEQWWHLSPSARRGLFGWLGNHLGRLRFRVREALRELGLPAARSKASSGPSNRRHELLTETDRLARELHETCLPFHLLSLALAPHPEGARYALAFP